MKSRRNEFLNFCKVGLLLGLLFYATSYVRAAEIEILAVDFPPYEIEKPQNNLRGFDVEVVEAAFGRVGGNASFKFVPWKRALRMSQSGQSAGLLTCAKAPEREASYLLSDSISSATAGIYTSKDYVGAALNSPDGLALLEGTITVVAGYSSEIYLKELGITYDVSSTDVAAIKKIVNGRIDAFLTSKENTDFLMQGLDVEGKLLFHQIEQRLLYLCISRKWPNADRLLDQFNIGLKQLRDEGIYDKIHARYR